MPFPPGQRGAQAPGWGQGPSRHLYWTRVLTKLVNVTCPRRAPSVSQDRGRVTGTPRTVQTLCQRPARPPASLRPPPPAGPASQGSTVTAWTAPGPVGDLPVQLRPSPGPAHATLGRGARASDDWTGSHFCFVTSPPAFPRHPRVSLSPLTLLRPTSTHQDTWELGSLPGRPGVTKAP